MLSSKATALLDEPAVAHRGLRIQFEDRFDFDGDIPRKRAHADGAAGGDTVVVAEHFGEEFAASVDHLRMGGEVGGGIDHAEHFDQAFDFAQFAESFFEARQNCQAGLLSGVVAKLLINFGTNAAGH